jgi:hypothetical protein
MSGIKKYMPVAAVFLFALLVRIIYNITVAHGYIPEYAAHQHNDIALNTTELPYISPVHPCIH